VLALPATASQPVIEEIKKKFKKNLKKKAWKGPGKKRNIS
jgi:hypothetical protein